MPQFRVTIEMQRVVEADSLVAAGPTALSATGNLKRARVTRIEHVEARMLNIEPEKHGQATDKIRRPKEASK